MLLGGALVSPHINIAQGVNLNDLTQGSYLCISSTTAATLQNCPVSLPFVLWVFKNNNAPYQAQMLVSQDGSYLRNTNTESWQRIATGIPSFYKDYSTLAALITAVGGIANRIATDADSINVTGVYRSNNDLQNVPSGWGSLLHIETEYALQFFIAGNSVETYFYVRQRLGTGIWKSWNRVTITAI